MSQAKRRPLFKSRNPSLERPDSSTRTVAAGAVAGTLDNLRFIWKQLLIVSAFVLGTVVVLITGLVGIQSLQRALTESYELVLNPTKALEEGLVNFADSQRYFELLRDPKLPNAKRTQTLESAQQVLETGNAQINLYLSQYASITRPEFRRTLTNTGRQDFLVDEQKALDELTRLTEQSTSLEQSYFEESTKRLPPVSLADGVIKLRGESRAQLQALIDVNDSFSSVQRDLANASATRAVVQMIVALVVSLLIAGALVFVVTRSQITRLAALEKSAREIRSGNLEMTVAVVGRDEIGTVGSTLNASIQQLREFVEQQRAEQQRGAQLQQNVSSFLGVAMRIAQGDLTQKGEVTEDALGNVVDAINVMTEEIGYLLKDVQQTAQQVSVSASSMNATSQGILSEAQAQSSIADTAQAQTVQVSLSIQRLALTAERGAETARQTLSASSEGTKAVQDAVAQLASIRNEINAITAGTKSLSERSAEISEVVRTISRFASQTNMLALGASLEAAGAGEAGARFAAVASAVRGLADESAKAATRVTLLVRDVQTEIAQLSALARSGSDQAAAGTKVAQEAAQRLTRIAELADESAESAAEISSLATSQVESVESVRGDVQRIALTALSTETESRGGQVAAEQLRSLSESLTRSLERFRLPV